MDGSDRPPAGLEGIRALLRAPGMGAFMAGRMVAAAAGWMERLALGWMAWQATGSTAFLGLIAFLRLAPSVALTPLGGALADRVGSVAILARAHVALGALMAAMAAVAAAGPPSPWLIAAAALALGAAHALAVAPFKTAVARLAPSRLIGVAVPVGSATFHAAAFLGPAAAGAIIAVAGPAPVFLAAAAAALGFAALLRSMPAERAAAGGAHTDAGRFWPAVAEALRDPLMGPVFALHAAFALLMRPVIDLMPAVAAMTGGDAAATLGLLTGAMGAGALVGAVWLALKGEAGLRGRMLGGAALGIVAALALAAAASPLWAAAALAALGAALTVRAAGGATLVQLALREGARGRVMAAWSLTLRLGAALGGLGLGLLAEAIGLRAAIAAGALVAVAALVAARRALRRNGPA